MSSQEDVSLSAVQTPASEKSVSGWSSGNKAVFKLLGMSLVSCILSISVK